MRTKGCLCVSNGKTIEAEGSCWEDRVQMEHVGIRAGAFWPKRQHKRAATGTIYSEERRDAGPW